MSDLFARVEDALLVAEALRDIAAADDLAALCRALHVLDHDELRAVTWLLLLDNPNHTAQGETRMSRLAKPNQKPKADVNHRAWMTFSSDTPEYMTTVREGDVLPGSDPIVQIHRAYFLPADTSEEDVRRHKRSLNVETSR